MAPGDENAAAVFAVAALTQQMGWELDPASAVRAIVCFRLMLLAEDGGKEANAARWRSVNYDRLEAAWRYRRGE